MHLPPIDLVGIPVRRKVGRLPWQCIPSRSSADSCNQGVMPLALRPFVRDQLPLVEPWFEDPETQRWLGGPDWPCIAFDLADTPLGGFRGAQETGHYLFLAWDGNAPVGYIDCGTSDRWTTWEGGPVGRGVVSVIDAPSASLAYVTDPARRRRGYGVGTVTLLMRVPELEHVALFAAGIEPGNTASVRCMGSAGFEPLDPVPDWEGIVYYATRGRPEVRAAPASPGCPRTPGWGATPQRLGRGRTFPVSSCSVPSS